MRVNALVRGPRPARTRAPGTSSTGSPPRCPRSASWSCTGRSSVAQRVRGLRAGADDWVTKPAHPEEVLARVEAVVRRRKQASARVDDRPARGRRARDPGRPVPGLRPRQQRRPHQARVRGAAAARADRREGAPARGDLPVGLGLRDGARRPLRGRLRPEGPAEAREGLAGLELHPHALRRRLPLPARAGRGRRRRARARPARGRALRSIRIGCRSSRRPTRSRCWTRASPPIRRSPASTAPRSSRPPARAARAGPRPGGAPAVRGQAPCPARADAGVEQRRAGGPSDGGRSGPCASDATSPASTPRDVA